MKIIDCIEQGTRDWLFLKLGVISASRASEFSGAPKLAQMPNNLIYSLTDKVHCYELPAQIFSGKNKLKVEKELRESLPRIYSETRNGYISELVGQTITGDIPDEMSFKQCEWGKKYEDEARAYFEFESGLKINQVAFIYKDDKKRIGISPDGLINNEKSGLEIKCPFTTKVFVDFALSERPKNEYYEQCQFSMWVTGYDNWYFANYDPRIKNKKLHYIKISRCEKMMQKYDLAEIKFISDMDGALDKFGVKFGEQWAADY